MKNDKIWALLCSLLCCPQLQLIFVCSIRTDKTSRHPLYLTWRRPPSSPPARWDARSRLSALCEHFIEGAATSEWAHCVACRTRWTPAVLCAFQWTPSENSNKARRWHTLLAKCVNIKHLFVFIHLQGSCFGSDEIKAIILRFLQQWVSVHDAAGSPTTSHNLTGIHVICYGCVHASVWLCSRYYSIYDSGDRQSLLDAYHDGASLSMMTPYSTQNPSRYKVTCFNANKMCVVRPGT